MAAFKKMLFFSLIISLILQQVYVLYYYFKGEDEVECSVIDSVTILDSGFQRLSSVYNVAIVEENKDSNHHLYNIFFLIMTYPDNDVIRDTLRSTWISELANHITLEYAFVIGLSSLSEEKKTDLKLEEERYHDIVFLENHTDNELNVTLKVLISYVWAYQNVKSKFLVKLRDDSYVAVDNLLSWFKEETVPETGLVMGSYLWELAVEKEFGRWAEPDWFICPDTYLPFPRGEGYIVSWDIVEFLHNYADQFRIYRHDDITLGLWLCGLKLNRIDSIKIIPDFELASACSSDVLIIGNMESQHLKNMHQLWNTDNMLCSVNP